MLAATASWQKNRKKLARLTHAGAIPIIAPLRADCARKCVAFLVVFRSAKERSFLGAKGDRKRSVPGNSLAYASVSLACRLSRRERRRACGSGGGRRCRV